MRQFIVLGFTTNSNSEQGKQIHLGSDRGEAIAVTNRKEAGLARKELFELARPHMTRHFGDVEPAPKKAKQSAKEKASAGT